MDDDRLICEKHGTMLVFDTRIRELVCYPCREATSVGIGRAIKKKDFMAIEPEEDKHMFKYEVHLLISNTFAIPGWTYPEGLVAFQDWLNEQGKEGKELVSSHALDDDEITVVLRIHHSA